MSRVARYRETFRRAFVGLAVAAMGILIAETIAREYGMGTDALRLAFKVLAVNLLGCGGIGLVLLYAGRPGLWWLRRKRLAYIGSISYGLYMVHFIVYLLGDDIAKSLGMGGRPFWREALMMVVIFALAALSWRYIERPILGLKDRFTYQGDGRATGRGLHRRPGSARVEETATEVTG